jgi:2-dehydrotetronate isomerase
MKLSAHLGYQFTEYLFLDRFAAAAHAGYTAVEFPSPYLYEISAIKSLLEANALELVQIGTPTGTRDAHEKGLAALKGRETEFMEGVSVALSYARALNCPSIHVMAGIERPDVDVDLRLYVANVTSAVDHLAEHGIKTLVEVMSPSAVPGYVLSSFDLAKRLFESVANPSLQLLFDTYHAAVLHGDVVSLLNEWMPKIGHIQISDFPGRHEPGTGDLPFQQIFNDIDAARYTGWVGCEYHPRTTTADSLLHLRPYLGAPKR